MFHVFVIGQRLNDGVPFCTSCQNESLHRVLRSFEEEFPNAQILSFYASNIQGGNYEVRKHSTIRNPQ